MLKPPNPYVLIAGIVVLAGTLAFGFLQGRKFEQGAQALDEQKLAAIEDRAARGAAREISRIKVQNIRTTQVLERETQTNTVYAECKHSDSGLSALNAILENRAIPAGDRSLPAPDAAP